jgi:hypothetical protein
MFYASRDNNYFAKPPTCRLLCIGNCISNISSRLYVYTALTIWQKNLLFERSLLSDQCGRSGGQVAVSIDPNQLPDKRSVLSTVVSTYYLGTASLIGEL